MANQEAFASARVIYVLCSIEAKTINRKLRENLDATRMDDTFYRIIGGERTEGDVIVSQFDEAVGMTAKTDTRSS